MCTATHSPTHHSSDSRPLLFGLSPFPSPPSGKVHGVVYQQRTRLFSVGRSVCAGEENHTANLHTSSGLDIYYILRSVTSLLFVVSAVLRIFPPTTENLEGRTAAITKIPFSLKELPADQSFQNLFQPVPGKSLALINFFFGCLI